MFLRADYGDNKKERELIPDWISGAETAKIEVGNIWKSIGLEKKGKNNENREHFSYKSP